MVADILHLMIYLAWGFLLDMLVGPGARHRDLQEEGLGQRTTVEPGRSLDGDRRLLPVAR